MALAKLVLTRFVVAAATHYTFLGVRLDEQLRWREQAAAVLQRSHLAAYNICRLVRPLGPPGASVIGRLCQAVLLPSMCYGLALWRPTAADLDALLSVLCRPLRRVLSLPRGVSRFDLLAEYGILPPAVQRMRLLVALHMRFVSLYAVGGHLASAEFVSDGVPAPRIMAATAVAAECANVLAVVGGAGTVDSRTVGRWWHEKWSVSSRVAELRPLLSRDWLSRPAVRERAPPRLPVLATILRCCERRVLLASARRCVRVYQLRNAQRGRPLRKRRRSGGGASMSASSRRGKMRVMLSVRQSV